MSHPDITDRFGRVWVWKARDLYTHDSILCVPSLWITSPDMQLPNRKLGWNHRYAGLCAICKSEW